MVRGYTGLNMVIMLTRDDIRVVTWWSCTRPSQSPGQCPRWACWPAPCADTTSWPACPPGSSAPASPWCLQRMYLQSQKWWTTVLTWVHTFLQITNSDVHHLPVPLVHSEAHGNVILSDEINFKFIYFYVHISCIGLSSFDFGPKSFAGKDRWSYSQCCCGHPSCRSCGQCPGVCLPCWPAPAADPGHSPTQTHS